MSASFTTTLAENLRPPRLVWLELVLAVPPADPLYEQFRARLHAFLRDSGLAGVLAGERLALIGTPGPVHPADKALVMHWLIQQSPVLMIVVRRPSRDAQGGAGERGTHERREGRRHG